MKKNPHGERGDDQRSPHARPCVRRAAASQPADWRFAVDSHGPPGVWRLTCEIDADDATVESLLLQIQNVVGVRKATATSIPSSGDIMNSSVRVYYEADTDRARLRDRVFTIIGYGSQGHAHAQNPA